MHTDSTRGRCARTFTAATFALLVAASVGGGTLAKAQRAEAGESVALTPAAIPDLEEAFWRCDHASATRMVDMTEGAECAAATQALKDKRFGGDFGAMLEWWKGNKREAYERLERDHGADDGSPA